MRVVVLLLVALVLPAATAKQGPAPAWEATVTPTEVDTTLYFHVINVQDMPINTQVPDPAFTDNFGFGPGAATVTCLHPTTGQATQGSTRQAYHTYYGYSSPSYVEYDYPSNNGDPRTHPERGLGYDIPLNRSAPVVLHWFLGESTGVNQGEAERAPLTNVVVRVTVRHGDAISVDDKAYDSGEVVMQGATDAVTAFGGQVVGPGASQVSASQVGGRWVYDFAVPLAVGLDHLSRATGFNARIDVLMENAACQEGSLMPGTVGVFSDADHLPRIELRNGKPLEVRYAVASESGNDTLTLAWSVNSGWGNYDVDVANATLEVFGPVSLGPMPAFHTVQRYQEVYHHMEPVQQTWGLDAKVLPDGRYTAVFQVPNLQHTTVAQARLPFYVQDGQLIEGEPQEAPAVPAALVLAGLAVAVAVRRRT